MPQPEPPGRGVRHRRGRRPGLAQQRRQHGRVLGRHRHRPGELGQGQRPRPGRRCAVQLGAPAGHHQPALGGELLAQPGQQRGLALPGLAGDQGDAATTGAGVGGQRGERRQLGLPAHEHVGVVVHCGWWRGDRAGRQRVHGGHRGVAEQAQRFGALGEDRGFQFHQRGPRVQSEFVGQHAPGPAQRGQRVGLAPTAPQGERVQPPALLAQWLVPGELVGVGHGPGGVPGAQCRGHPQLTGAPSQLGQPAGLGRRPVLVAGLGERRAPPQRQRLVQQRPGRARVGADALTGVAAQPLEPPRVHRVGRQPHRVAGWGADQQPGRGARWAAGFEQPAQVGHVRLERGHRLGRRFTAPQVLDHPVHRHDLAARRDQQGEHRALPRPTERDRHAVRLGGDRPQHAYPQHGAPILGAPPSVRSAPSPMWPVPSRPGAGSKSGSKSPPSAAAHALCRPVDSTAKRTPRTTSTEPRVDPHELAVIHRGPRRESRMAVELTSAVRPIRLTDHRGLELR